MDAMKEITPSAMREVFIEIPNVKWNDIGGLMDVKEEIKKAIEYPLKHKNISVFGVQTAFEKHKNQLPKGILLYGPPGTGKTMLAKAAATESTANFISVKGPELISKWVGESEKGIRELFRRARQAAPCIIFLDEMDAIAGTRITDSGTSHNQKLVSQLLTELDGVQELNDVIVIGATNRYEMIDPAITRGGRFDKIINVGTPDQEARRQIIKIHFKQLGMFGTNITDNKEYLNEIVESTDGFTGADIAGIKSRLITEDTGNYLEEYESGEKTDEQIKEKWRTKELQEMTKILSNKNNSELWRSTEFEDIDYSFNEYPLPKPNASETGKKEKINSIQTVSNKKEDITLWEKQKIPIDFAVSNSFIESSNEERWKYDTFGFNSEGLIFFTSKDDSKKTFYNNIKKQYCPECDKVTENQENCDNLW